MQKENNPPAWAAPALRFILYNFVLLVSSLVADVLAALAAWVMSRYYIWQAGSELWQEKRFYYYAVIIFVLEITMALAHFIWASAMQKHLSSRVMRVSCVVFSSLLVFTWAYFIVPPKLFAVRWMAVLPVVLAHAAGGILGFMQNPEQNRLRDMKWIEKVLNG